ncbi:MAG: NAD(P)H-quinone oxidoreductase [Rhodoferax sp.]|nr:NAD(P)H-quinone oxidoreductase [Rhodoferax sp.]
MRAFEISSPGTPDVLRLVHRPAPVAGAGEVCIRVSASGINRPDVLQRVGKYPPPAGASDIPGLEVAGTIVDGDPKAMAHAGFRLGDRVCALVAGGGYAELCSAPVAQCLPVPLGWTDAQAAGLPETCFTVWTNVFERGQLQSGDVLLVQGGTSGIGVTAIQLAKAFGATVIATAGSDDKCAACLSLGADFAINYRTHDFELEAMRITQGRGVDVILDMVAGPYVVKEVRCLAQEGRLLLIAVQGGVQAEFDAGLVLRKRLTLSGSTLRARSAAVKAEIARALRVRVWPMLERNVIRPVVHQVFAVGRASTSIAAAQAHTVMESNVHIGKLVLDWETA